MIDLELMSGIAAVSEQVVALSEQVVAVKVAVVVPTPNFSVVPPVAV